MADTGKLQVRLVTPDRMLIDTTVDAVELPARNGYIEVLYGHAPLLAELGAGDVTLHGAALDGSTPGASDRYNVAWGFVEVLPERVTILAESAQRPEEIDRTAAEQKLKDGQKVWDEAGTRPAQYERANEMMREAEATLQSAAGSPSAKS